MFYKTIIREYFYQDLREKLVSDPIFVSFHFYVELALAARLQKWKRFFFFVQGVLAKW